MTIRVALEHRTSYEFAEPVHVYPHTIRLRPAPHSRTPIPSYSLRIEPAGHFLNWQQDPFGNWLARVVFPDKVSRLEITVDLTADMTVINPFDFFVEDWAATFPFAYPQQLRDDLAPYLQPVDDAGEGSGPAPEVTAWLERVLPTLLTAPRDAAPGEGTRIVDFIVALNRAVRESIDYTVRLEAGVQTPQHTLERGIGSCRDSAWLLVSALRQLGLAARFVSGYLVQLTSDLSAVGDDSLNGPAEDFTDLHAWAEVYLPGAGWIGFDVTSGMLTGEGHIPVAATPHYRSAAPISGTAGAANTDFNFEMSVERVRDGQFFLWWAGAAPALLFLALERLRDLGRSPHTTRAHLALAAAYGLPYAFASHFAPDALEQAVRVYRERFTPSEQLDAPYVIAAANVIAADDSATATDAADQVLRARVRMLAGRVGGSDSRLDDDMVTALLDTAVGAQARHMLTHTIVGDATQVAEGLRQFASLAGADEVMLTNPAPALDLRLHALEILADIHTDGDGRPPP